MKFYYLCSFVPENTSGKNRATRQKLDALDKLVDLEVIYPQTKNTKHYAATLAREIFLYFDILNQKDVVVISRDFSGILLSLLPRRLRGYYTVREIHSDFLGEIELYNKSVFSKMILYFLGFFKNLADKKADLRIFNSPTLKMHFEEWGDGCYVYNGGETLEHFIQDITTVDCIKAWQHNQSIDFTLCYTGAVSAWHGVDRLVHYIKTMNKNSDCKYGLVLAGGRYHSTDNDDADFILNISPADPDVCRTVINECHAAMLPCAQIRVSPGSPLKLYDYIMNQCCIVGPKNILGYSDELQRYGKAILVDFEENIAHEDLEKWLRNSDQHEINNENQAQFLWSTRMQQWIDYIEQYKSRSDRDLL